MNVREYLESQGRAFPEADADGSTSGEAYAAAGLPMVVACTGCEMTMALTPDRACDSGGRVYCAQCADDGTDTPEYEADLDGSSTECERGG